MSATTVENVPAPAEPERPPAPEKQSDLVDLPETSRNDLVERLWRLFCSLKLMIVLTTLFTVAMALNTFINPQEDALANIEAAFADRPVVLWLYKAFELYAPFKSWWFTLVLILFGLNNIASSIERLPRIFLIVRNPQRLLTDGFLRGLRNRKTVPRAGLTADQVAATLTRRGYTVSSSDVDGVTHLFAERGAWTRFGVWVVHLALLVILAGGILGRYLGFEGTMDLRDGGGTSAFMLERLPDGVIVPRSLGGFSIRCDNFDLDRFADGSARRYASDLSVLDEAGQVIHQQRIIVNDPLHWGGLTFYQASFRELNDQSFAKLTITDLSTGEKKTTQATPSAPVFLGDGTIRYTVVDYQPAFGSLGPAVQVVREEGPPPGTPGVDPSQVKSSSFWVFKDYPDFDATFRGDRFGLRFEALEPLYFTGLQVGYDPGVFWINVGAIFLFVGLFITFWTVHRRLWVRVEGQRVTFGGAAHRNKERFREEFDAFVAEVTTTGTTKDVAADPASGAAT